MKLIVSIFFCLAVFAGNAQKPKLFEAHQRLGNIQQIVISEWDDDTTKDPNDVHTIVYNEAGYPIKAERKQEGYYRYYLELTYVRDTLVSKKTYRQKTNEEYTRYDYDAQGRVTTERYSVKDGGGYYFSIERQYRPKLIIKRKYQEFKSFYEHKEYYLNDDETDSCVVEYNEKGKVMNKELFFYDEQGREKSTEFYDKGKKLTSYTTSEYPNDSTEIYTQYDKKGEVIFYSEFCEGANNEFVYLKMEGLTTDTLTTYNYTYEYDEVGNWITQTCISGGELIFQKRRDITYFE